MQLSVIFLNLLFSKCENKKIKGKINKEDKPNLIAAKSYILNCVLTPIRLTINQKDQIKTTSNAAIIPRIFYSGINLIL